VILRVLGSAAGGGLPQWNCGCTNCCAARAGDPATPSRLEESVAFSADGEDWFLIQASPDVRRQIESFPALWPRRPRHTPVAAILLTNGDLDHVLGLLCLRESQPLVIYATHEVRRGFVDGNSVYRTLERFPGQISWRPFDLDGEQPLLTADGSDSGLAVRALAAPGKRPLHLEGDGDPAPGDNVGLLIRDRRTGGRLAYFSALAALTAPVRQQLAESDCLFVDGTFWTDDELIAAGLGERRGRQMAHLPVSGPDGSLDFLRTLSAPRKFLIHLNNTNPLLRADSPERAALAAARVEVAHEGLELRL
jgi:pyrroloquinoline quinone biosynthesis protein B